ncbi:MAG: alpha-N-arabinofuranosidase [Spirochaetales bacterium]|nr:alpha-N-arabinofuranosidase [Spirochaetales bacterium]
MEPTTIKMHTSFQIGQVDPRVFGGFLEHMGRAVYQGVYEPGSPHADEKGFRKDVLKALRELEMTVMRYPGGNFASGYHWPDGVGPKDHRPKIRELAWQSVEPNQFGTDEYITLCRDTGWTPMLTVNLGTGTAEEARNWVEYCNSVPGTRYADMRAANGSTDPHAVKLWCLGNEMDGPWQLGHVPADQYAIRAQQAAKMMKDVDRSIELVVCGSCNTGLPTYIEWDRQVLEYIGGLADYISLHRYVGNRDDDTPDFLAVGNAIDRQIAEIDAVCRYVQAKQRSNKRAYLCFDEWNVWYKNRSGNGEGQFAPHLSEEVYNLEDALVVAGFLNSFVRHADVVKIANIAQIVNVISPLLTRDDKLLVQSTFYPFAMFSKRKNGASLQMIVDGPKYTAKTYGEAHYVDASAILDKDQLHLFAVNRSLSQEAVVEIELVGARIAALENGECLTGTSPKSANSFEKPDVVRPRLFTEAKIANGKARVALPPLSVTAMTLSLAG